MIVLLKLDNCKVPAKLMGKTFLDWADLNVKPHFWQRLKDAIGQPEDFPRPQPIENQDDGEVQPVENPDEIGDVVDVPNIVIEPVEKVVEIDKDLPDDSVDNNPEVQLIDNVEKQVNLKKALKVCHLQ